MAAEKGNLSINSENFLPIIKKWLYTDKDIFVRELVSNACDAVTKLKKLQFLGEADHIPAEESYRVNVILDTKAKTLQIVDNGIGMTDEEIKKYINQIAFSGATDFLSKYQEKADQSQEIIGHFGLGFYSAFMVAERVEIDTLSYQEGASAAKWSCEGGIDYEMEAGTREERGTTITLFLSEDGEEFLEESRLYAALKKYCAFMPVEIYVEVIRPEDAEKKPAKKGPVHIKQEDVEGLTKEELKEKLMGEGEAEEEEPEEPKPLNETSPLWLRQPKDCTDEDYKKFYHDVFFDMNDPLFWIHLNMDYPFRLKGILYFPRLVDQMDVTEGEIKLYSNQVYIADNIKEVVPEFLLLLKGTLDCPDLPLNVSRSALQNDGYAAKMSGYITKKVADKLNQLFKNERETYEGFWDDISLFIKFGCMKEENLYDKVKDSLLLKTIDGKYVTVAEYLEENKEKHENKMYFVSDENQQAQYIRLFREEGLSAVLLDTPVDKPFVSFLEHKNPGVRVERVDSTISDSLKEAAPAEQSEDQKKEQEALHAELKSLFAEVLGKENLTVKTETLKSAKISAMLLLSEQARRMQEMQEAYARNHTMKDLFAQMPKEETLVLNDTNRLVQLFLKMRKDEGKAEDVKLLVAQLYDLALLSHKQMTSDEMTAFIDRSNVLLEKLAAFEVE